MQLLYLKRKKKEEKKLNRKNKREKKFIEIAKGEQKANKSERFFCLFLK